jgi:amidase
MVPKSSGHFTIAELDLIETNSQNILLIIKENIRTFLEVTKAFCKTAIVTQQLIG